MSEWRLTRYFKVFTQAADVATTAPPGRPIEPLELQGSQIINGSPTLIISDDVKPTSAVVHQPDGTLVTITNVIRKKPPKATENEQPRLF